MDWIHHILGTCGEGHGPLWALVPSAIAAATAWKTRFWCYVRRAKKDDSK